MDCRLSTRIAVLVSLLVVSGATGAPPILAGSQATADVQVIVTARDQHDRHVTGLTAANLVVLEEGASQTITSLTPVGSEPVTMTLLIDASNSLEDLLAPVQETAVEIVRRLRPGDRAEVFSFHSSVRREVPFTDDRARLETAIRGIRRSGATSLHNAVHICLREHERRSAVPGAAATRHILVVLSDGRDTASLIPVDELEKTVRRATAVIYAVAPTGEIPDKAHALLRAMARATGGRALIPPSRVDPTVTAERLWSDILHHQLLRYSSSHGARDGGFRRIEVRAAVAGVTLGVREGYFVPRSR